MNKFEFQPNIEHVAEKEERKNVISKILEKYPNISKKAKNLCTALALLMVFGYGEALAGEKQVDNVSKNVLESRETIKSFSKEAKESAETKHEKFFTSIDEKLGVANEDLKEVYKYTLSAESLDNDIAVFEDDHGVLEKEGNNMVVTKFSDTSIIEATDENASKMWDNLISEVRIYELSNANIEAKGDLIEIDGSGDTIEKAIQNALKDIIGNQFPVSISTDRNLELQNTSQNFTNNISSEGIALVDHYEVTDTEEETSDDGSRIYKVHLKVQLGEVSN